MVDKRLLTLYFSVTSICMIYGLQVPFLPIIGQDKSLSEWRVGVIFAVHPLAGLVASPFVGSFLYKVGRRNTIWIAYLCTALSLVAAGLSTYMDSDEFFAVNICARVLSGIAGVSCFGDGKGYAVIAIIVSDYPDNLFAYVGYVQSSAGLGFLLGPLAGAGLYVALGYFGTFFVSAAFYVLSSIGVYILLGPDREYFHVHKDENIFSLAFRPKIFVTFLPLCFGTAVMGAQNMFISTHLRDNGLSTSWVAAVFAITGVTFLITCLILVKTIDGCNKKVANVVGGVVSVVAMALVGPWPEGIPEGLPAILTGFALTQVGLGVLFVEIMPSLIEVATVDLGLPNDDKLTDKLSCNIHSAIETSGVVAGEFIGPLVQGALIPLLGVRDSCGCFAGFGIVVILVYIATFLRRRRQYRPIDIQNS